MYEQEFNYINKKVGNSLKIENGTMRMESKQVFLKMP